MTVDRQPLDAAVRHEGRNTRVGRCLAAAGMIVGQVMQNVALPVLADSIGQAGGSPYFVVWFACLSFVVLFGAAILLRSLKGGLCSRSALLLSREAQKDVWKVGFYNALNGMMVVFSSPSTRTAPFLQAILGNFMIPITVLVRIWFMKVYPCKWEVLAAMVVLCGVFISVYPTMVHRSESGGSIFWPLCFMAGFIPAAFMNVTEESALSQNQNARMGIFVFWLNFWQLVFVSLFFWVDVIPGYGMSPDLEAWAQHMRNGMTCFLLKFTSSATWQAIVTSLVGPIGILWWAVFEAQPEFHWGPSWGIDKSFALLGLSVMLPGIVAFKLAGKQKPKTSEQLMP
eukprot:Skav202242  [mRNA]  locus=scaffold1417:124358:126530:+ [translate_table: standard]